MLERINIASLALMMPSGAVHTIIPGRRSEEEASPESILPDLWLWIPGSRPAAEPRNDWTKVLPEHALPVPGEASLALPRMAPRET